LKKRGEEQDPGTKRKKNNEATNRGEGFLATKRVGEKKGKCTAFEERTLKTEKKELEGTPGVIKKGPSSARGEKKAKLLPENEDEVKKGTWGLDYKPLDAGSTTTGGNALPPSLKEGMAGMVSWWLRKREKMKRGEPRSHRKGGESEMLGHAWDVVLTTEPTSSVTKKDKPSIQETGLFTHQIQDKIRQNLV